MTGCRAPDTAPGCGRRPVLVDTWCGRHGNQVRQPETAANHLPPYRKQAMGSAAAPRRVSCGPNAATYVGPGPVYTPTPRHMPVAGDQIFGDPAAHHRPGAAHAFPACYETSAIITGFSLTRSYPMMGEEG